MFHKAPSNDFKANYRVPKCILPKSMPVSHFPTGFHTWCLRTGSTVNLPVYAASSHTEMIDPLGLGMIFTLCARTCVCV